MHFALAAKFVVQVVAEIAKFPAFVIAMLVSDTVWLFVRVNVFGALVVSTACTP